MKRTILTAFTFALTAFAADEPKLAARFLARPEIAADPKEQLGEWGTTTLDAVQKEIVPPIQHATKITFYSLAPSEWPTDENRNDPRRFHGWRILGSTEITTADDLAVWRQQIVEGVIPGAAVGVFYPHYGIRVHARTPLDVVACFETSQWWLYSSRLPKDTFSRGAALDGILRDRLNKLFDGKNIPRDATSLMQPKAK